MDTVDARKKQLRLVLLWLLVASRGGSMRLKILNHLRNEPSNAHRISSALDVNYRTVEHHLKVLSENSLIISKGGNYGTVYFLDPYLEENYFLVESLFDRKRGDTER